MYRYCAKENHLLSDEVIDQILAMPDVIYNRDILLNQHRNSQSFRLAKSNFDLQHIDAFDSVDELPMRWIKGDTPEHLDREVNSGDSGNSGNSGDSGDSGGHKTTYLVYLTSSTGHLVIDDVPYPITRGTGYSFPASSKHGTIGTGTEPRLLIGPMSENGNPVGTLPNSLTATGTVTIRIASVVDLQCKINDGDWEPYARPLTITNGNTSTRLVVLFEDLTALDPDFYIVCGSHNIQFGSTSAVSTITVQGVTDYSGLINSNDKGDIYVFNIRVVAVGTTLATGQGWIGQSGFGSSSGNPTHNTYIVGCSSNGPIPSSGGGIVGSLTARGANSSGTNRHLRIIGCSSTGDIGASAGGIVGAQCGKVTCDGCWSSGAIGVNSGGIIGPNALLGKEEFSVTATNCYSTGSIDTDGGGIYGLNAAEGWINEAFATNCYSTGSSGEGGIFAGATYTGTWVFAQNTATNCYATGTTRLAPVGDTVLVNSYGTLVWVEDDANVLLLGLPGSDNVGSTWIRTGVDQPYLLKDMGYSPYASVNIDGTPAMVRDYTASIDPVTDTETAPAPGLSATDFSIIQPDTTLAINPDGSIDVSNSSGGIYNLVLRNSIGSGYSISSYNLTVESTVIEANGTVTMGSDGYSIDGGSNWTPIAWPCTIVNTDIQVELVVLFQAGYIVSKNYQYFICGSDNIRFGSTSIAGGLTSLVVQNCDNYLGLIRNGTLVDDAFTDISIMNLKLLSDNSALVLSQTPPGWIAQAYFGNGTIINCHTYGNIRDYCGGIVGSYAGINMTVKIIGCSSSGNIAVGAGGIVGSYCQNVLCRQCWSTGNVGPDGGGIYGIDCTGNGGSSSTAEACYSTGNLEADSGGIYGSNAGAYDGEVSVYDSYSRGGTSGSGGIFGPNVKNGIMNNCYCTGTADLYIAPDVGSTVGDSVNTYAAVVWNTDDARAALANLPDADGVGDDWTSTQEGPFIITTIGYSPYLDVNVSYDIDFGWSLLQAHSESIFGGQPTTAGPTGDYQILYSSEPSITLTGGNGRFTTTSSTPSGTHQIYILTTAGNEGYSISTVNLTISPQLVGDSTIYLRQGNNVQYSYNETDWSDVSWPCGITNDGVGTLSVIFTDLALTSVEHHFVILSDRINIGSTSLNSDGTRPIITISGVADYPGLISNEEGYSYISVFNLEVAADGSTLAQYGGWLGQRYYANNGTPNYFVNCHASGNISVNGGGIVGADAAIDGFLYVTGCSSSGSIDEDGGGIIGSGSHNTICEGCWSTGGISPSGGGIYGRDTVTIDGGNKARYCYSTGTVGDSAGGIVGTASTGRIVHCYSRGSVLGGYGIGPGTGLSIIGCYCFNGEMSEGALGIGNYEAYGVWDDTAVGGVLGSLPPSGAGDIWVSPIAGEPYELRTMGYSPYLQQNIVDWTLEVAATKTAYVGSPTSRALVSGRAYQIIDITPASDRIAVNRTTGSISVKVGIEPGVYHVLVRNTGSYNYSTVDLQVVDDPTVPCLLKGTLVLTATGYVKVEDLTRQMQARTGDGRLVPITGIFSTRVTGDMSTCPALLARGSIGPNYPPQDLRISQSHLIKYGEKWVNPGYFPVDTHYLGREISYYHIRLPCYRLDNIVIDNGIIVESLGHSAEDFIEYERRIGGSLTPPLKPPLLNFS